VLDAKGVVLWAADAAGTTLRPVMSHGYSSRVLAKLGTIQLDADNVTARAFRSAEAQVLAGQESSDSGALAVPLVTGGGCVGVLAAETRRSRPSPELLPLARILAAQFSALVTPAEPAEAPARSAHAQG
jgi:GAF domain-containing protein